MIPHADLGGGPGRSHCVVPPRSFFPQIKTKVRVRYGRSRRHCSVIATDCHLDKVRFRFRFRFRFKVSFRSRFRVQGIFGRGSGSGSASGSSSGPVSISGSEFKGSTWRNRGWLHIEFRKLGKTLKKGLAAGRNIVVSDPGEVAVGGEDRVLP